MIILFALSDAAVRVGCLFSLASHLGKACKEKNRKRHIFRNNTCATQYLLNAAVCVGMCVFISCCCDATPTISSWAQRSTTPHPPSGVGQLISVINHTTVERLTRFTLWGPVSGESSALLGHPHTRPIHPTQGCQPVSASTDRSGPLVNLQPL